MKDDCGKKTQNKKVKENQRTKIESWSSRKNPTVEMNLWKNELKNLA